MVTEKAVMRAEAGARRAMRIAPGRAATASAASGAVPASRLHGLPPVLGRDARVLILGSFPGEASLAAAQYYAHPRNHFWPLLGAVLDAPLLTLRYRERLASLRSRRIALWDTIVACERRGSLDGAIRNAERGDVARVHRVARDLALVCFNGKTAARAEPVWREAGYRTLVLPSSSPANTRPFAEKLAAWRAIGEFLRVAPTTNRPIPMG
jgi:hypoxanthine-DNA glycosylase